jgi:hypothetical protein
MIPGLLWRMSLVATTIVVTGCTGRRAPSEPCDPVVAGIEYAGMPVYRACGVDRPARAPRTLPPLHFRSSSPNCAKVVLQVIVDGGGRPAQGTVRVLRADDTDLAAQVVESLGDMLFQPALKNGAPVPQLVLFERGVRGGTVPFTVGAPGARAPGAPSC